ncbi:MAG: D-glycero-beta-D-manno-heptose 1-phosphate adenylyltransferase [Candidatus Omnitrophica bacterium]|nr:D-glycero-beta-D-manno-heptose 1-phosphate adenylyltransferase [Candidatus Omnitrophota bacterium]
MTKIVAGLHKHGKSVVFTNGCFDILHYGHVKYLETAKSKGDFLVVGVNSDSSVRKLKGKNRPIVSQKFRSALVAALESVDFVVIFSEKTPLKTIRALKPEVLVKGGNWKEDDIVGADFVRQRGGRVYSIKFIKGFSTTDIIKKIGKNS